MYCWHIRTRVCTIRNIFSRAGSFVGLAGPAKCCGTDKTCDSGRSACVRVLSLQLCARECRVRYLPYMLVCVCVCHTCACVRVCVIRAGFENINIHGGTFWRTYLIWYGILVVCSSFFWQTLTGVRGTRIRVCAFGYISPIR